MENCSNHFGMLKHAGKLVSLRGMPNGEFAVRTGMPAFKRLLLKVAGRKYDQMAAKKNQSYYFIFVHEAGAGLPAGSHTGSVRRIGSCVGTPAKQRKSQMFTKIPVSHRRRGSC